MELHELRNKFIQSLEIKKRSPHTIRAYGNDLDQLVEYLGSEEPVDQLDEFAIHRFFQHLETCGYKHNTKTRKRKAVLSMLAYGQRKGWIPRDITVELTAGKYETSNKDNVLTEDEIVAFFAYMERQISDHTSYHKALGIRNRLIVELFLKTGCRIAEIASIEKDKITPTSLTVVGKGEKERTIPLFAKTARWLDRYWTEALPYFHASEYLFPSGSSGRHLSSRQIRDIITKASYAALGRHIHPHLLRHSFATNLLAKDPSMTNLKRVSRILGHVNPYFTLDTYIAASDDRDRDEMAVYLDY